MATCGKHFFFDSDCSACHEADAEAENQKEAERAHRDRLRDLERGDLDDLGDEPDGGGFGTCGRHMFYDHDCAGCRAAERSRDAAEAARNRHRELRQVAEDREAEREAARDAERERRRRQDRAAAMVAPTHSSSGSGKGHKPSGNGGGEGPGFIGGAILVVAAFLVIKWLMVQLGNALVLVGPAIGAVALGGAYLHHRKYRRGLLPWDDEGAVLVTLRWGYAIGIAGTISALIDLAGAEEYAGGLMTVFYAAVLALILGKIAKRRHEKRPTGT